MTPPDPPPPAAGWGEAAGACPDGACASAAVAANDVAPAITAAAKNPRRGMQQGQSEKAVRAAVADMDGSGAKLRRAELKAVGRRPYTSRAPLRQRRDRRAAKSRPGAQEAPRVDGHAVDPGLVMEMGAGRAAGRADAADERAGRNLLAGDDPDRGEVGVAGREAVAVVDLDHAAVAAGIFGRRDRAGGGRPRVGAVFGLEVEPGVHRRSAGEGIDAHAEAAREICLGARRAGKRQGGARLPQARELHEAVLRLRGGELEAVRLRT